MSFSLSLSSGFIKLAFTGTTSNKPTYPIFLQILKIGPLSSLEPNRRYKLILSDGIRLCSSVLSPKLNSLIANNTLKRYSIIKLINYSVFLVREKRLFVIQELEHIHNANLPIGSPISIHTESPPPVLPARKNLLKKDSLPFDLSNLHIRLEKKFSDVTFILSDNTNCYSHRFLLASRSEYFKNLFTTSMKERNQTTFDMKEWRPVIFRAMIEYLSVDQIPLSILMPHVTRDQSFEMLTELLIAARYFLLDSLLFKIERHIIFEFLDSDKVCCLATLAYSYDLDDLARACRYKFLSSLEEFQTPDSICELHPAVAFQYCHDPTLTSQSDSPFFQALLPLSNQYISFKNQHKSPCFSPLSSPSCMSTHFHQTEADSPLFSLQDQENLLSSLAEDIKGATISEPPLFFSGQYEDCIEGDALGSVFNLDCPDPLKTTDHSQLLPELPLGKNDMELENEQKELYMQPPLEKHKFISPKRTDAFKPKQLHQKRGSPSQPEAPVKKFHPEK